MPSNHLILCRPLLLLPSIFPSIRVFSNESVLHIRWPKYWSDLAGAFAEGLWKPLCFLTARGLSRLLPIIRVTSSHCPPRSVGYRIVGPPQASAGLHCTSNLFVKCKELQECTAQHSLSALPLVAWGTLMVTCVTLCVCVPRNLYDTCYEYTLYTFTTPVARTGTNLPIIQETQVRSLDQEDPLEKEMATHSSVLA